jgi:hypothetical protein
MVGIGQTFPMWVEGDGEILIEAMALAEDIKIEVVL